MFPEDISYNFQTAAYSPMILCKNLNVLKKIQKTIGGVL